MFSWITAQRYAYACIRNWRSASTTGPVCKLWGNNDTNSAQSYLDYLSRLKYNASTGRFRLSGIICTIGPASRSPEMLEKLMFAGMNVVRLNFSHGTHEYHAETIRNARQAIQSYSQKTGREQPVAIALDTKGPEIRTGLINGSPTEEIELKPKDSIKITTNKEFENKCSKDIVYVDYVNITKIVKPGNHMYVDDGLISLLIKDIKGDTLICEIENGGKLGSRKGCNLPGVPVDLPSVSERDKSDLKFGVEQNVDMVFASFIRNGAALTEIRKILGEKGQNIKVISKIENQQGMQNIDEIINASDGIMLARGDLGIEILTEEVIIAQKTIIARCNKVGKPVICATQMLESMTGKPRPTRAEASDVANAIFDGADCVMLSGETAKGKYPIECVKTMSNICRKVESVLWYERLQNELRSSFKHSIDKPALTLASVITETATRSRAIAIVVIGYDPSIAHMISRSRPACPIAFFTTCPQEAKQCVIFRGIFPIILSEKEVALSKNESQFETFLSAGLNKLFAATIVIPEKSPVMVAVNALDMDNVSVQIMTIECNDGIKNCDKTKKQ